LKRFDLRREKLEEHAIERYSDNALELRLIYLGDVSNHKTESLFFLDETGLDFNSFKRRFGRALVGIKANMVRKYVRTKRANIISCIGWDGVTGYRAIEDSTTTTDFNSFIIDLLPLLPPSSVLVLDNASFHKSPMLVAIVKSYGHHLLFLPPYSPDLNPIELSYSWLKKKLREEMDDLLNSLI